MKRIIPLVVLLLVAQHASAQGAPGNINIGGACTGGRNTPYTGQDDLNNQAARTLQNNLLCRNRNLAKDCSQVQLNAVQSCAAGACGTIYPITAAGAGDFAGQNMYKCHMERVAILLPQSTANDMAEQSYAHGTETATNAACAAAGLANGCTKNQAACAILIGSASGSDCKP